jgi:hypothetical protein
VYVPEDGTTWGDAESVKEVVTVRQVTMHELQVLRDAYAQDGDNGFSREIMSVPQSVARTEIVASIYKKNRVQKAEAAAWRMIDAAHEHAQGIRAKSLSRPLKER